MEGNLTGRTGKRRPGEAGMTMIELLVAMMISIVVLAASLAMLEMIARQQPRASHRSDRSQEARAVLERFTRDLRQVYAVNSGGSASIDILTYRRTVAGQPAEQRRVFIDCTSGNCTRAEGPAGGALGAPVTLFSGVYNPDIFTYVPDNVNPEFLKIKFRFNVNQGTGDPAKPLTLSDGVQLRNLSTPS